jgi:hypothetical protein
MCTYEFAEVESHCLPIPRGSVADALSWRPISDESGQNMLLLKKPKVYASTDRVCQDAQHPNKPKAYLFAWSTPITYYGDAPWYNYNRRGDVHPAVIPIRHPALNTAMVKYIHCTRGHAILVRKATELEVEVTIKDMECEDGDLILAVAPPWVWEKHIAQPGVVMLAVKTVIATVGTAIVWEKHIAKTDTPQKLSSVANSIRAAIVRQGKGTRQSKILWKVQGRRTTVAKQIIKKNALGFLCKSTNRGDAHPAVT